MVDDKLFDKNHNGTIEAGSGEVARLDQRQSPLPQTRFLHAKSNRFNGD
jgi:hypothetical protein